MGITEAASRLGLSVDSIRRRIRKGELSARRDNRGVWQVEIPDDAAAVHMQPSAMPMLAPPYAVPMQPPGDANGHDGAARELVEALRAQVADLTRRLDQADVDRRAERAAWDHERNRLLLLVERLTDRERQAPDPDARAEGAERRGAELQALVDGELAQLRAMLAALVQREQRATPESRPAPDSRRTSRPRRRGLIRILLGQ